MTARRSRSRRSRTTCEKEKEYSRKDAKTRRKNKENILPGISFRTFPTFASLRLGESHSSLRQQHGNQHRVRDGASNEVRSAVERRSHCVAEDHRVRDRRLRFQLLLVLADAVPVVLLHRRARPE